MEQFAKLHVSKKRANETMIELDLEPSVPPALLSKLIADKVQEATKTLRKEIQSLKSTTKSSLSKTKTKNVSAKNDSTNKPSAKIISQGAADQTNQVPIQKTGHQTTQQSTRTPSTKKKSVKQQIVPSSSRKKKSSSQQNSTMADAANDSTNASKMYGQSSGQMNKRTVHNNKTNVTGT